MTKNLTSFINYYSAHIDYLTILVILPLFFVFGNWMVTSFFILIIFWLFILDYKWVNNIIVIHDKFIVLGLLTIGLISVLNTPNLFTGLEYYSGTILVPIALFMIISNVSLKEGRIKLFLNLLILAGVILGAYSLYLSYFVIGSYNVRLASLWVDFNILAAFFMILIFFNILLLIYERNKIYKSLYVMSLVFILFGIVLTQTRGVWLSVVLSLAFYVIRRPKALIPSMIFIGVFLVSFFPIFLNRFLSVRYFLSDWSAVGRMQAWLGSILMIKDNFLFGVGFDTFDKLKYNYLSIFVIDVIHSHNTYLRLLVEMGIFGFIFYMFFYLKAFALSFMSLKFYSGNKFYALIIEGLQMSFVGLSIAFMFEPYFSLYGNSTIMIWMLMSVSYNLYYNKNLLNSAAFVR